MKILGLMRVKNEARWITQSVESLKALCDPVIVLDDHSTDGTPELCEAAGAIVHRNEFEGVDEARDKDFLLEKAGAVNPDWCFMLDGDEILDPAGVPVLKAAFESGRAPSYTVPFVYLWDSLNQIRVDRWYADTWRQSAWKYAPGHRFMRTRFGGNFHCGSVPQHLLGVARKVNARILHLGYLHREDRIRKWEWYNAIDPNNVYEDRYVHMILGDLPEYPATMRAKWAGPLELRTL